MYSKGVAYMCGGNVPFIRLFKGHSGYYAYDVNTNQLLRISKDLFNYLKVLLREKSASENPLISDELQLLQKKGYLSSHFPDHIKRLDADDLEYYLNFINELTNKGFLPSLDAIDSLQELIKENDEEALDLYLKSRFDFLEVENNHHNFIYKMFCYKKTL